MGSVFRALWRVIDRWWWRPSAARLLLWAAVAALAGTLDTHRPGQRVTAGQAVALAVVVIAIAALFITGARLIVNALVIGPVRALLIRRATGRSVHSVNGKLHERRRHARTGGPTAP